MQFWLKRMDVCVVKHPKGFFPVKVIWSSNGIHTNRLQCVPNCTCFFIELSLGGVHNGFAVFSVTAGNLVCISFPVLAKHQFIVCLCYDDSKFQQAVINFIDIYSLAHMKWDYKYHIVFAPKYRRKVFYKRKKGRDKRNNKAIMPVEGSRHNRYSYIGEHPAQNERFWLYGVS